MNPKMYHARRISNSKFSKTKKKEAPLTSCKESVVILVERKRSDVSMCESKERERDVRHREYARMKIY